MNTIHVIFQIITLLLLAFSVYAGYQLDGRPREPHSFKITAISSMIWLFLLTMGGFFTFGGV